MIAANYRKFPQALMQQLELRLDQAAQYFQDMTPTLRAIWARCIKPKKSQKPVMPTWATQQLARAKKMAQAVQAACMTLEIKEH